MEVVYLLVTGLFAGFVGSLFGLGGGIVIVPVLTLIFDMPMIEAVGTSLVSIVGVSTVASIDFLKTGRVDLGLGISLATVASAGAVAAGLLAQIIPMKFTYILFSAILLIASFYMARPKRITLIDEKYNGASNKLPGYGLSLIAGGISGLLGVGGGIIQVPVMRSIMKVPMKIATATSSYMIGIITAPVAFLYLLRGDVDLYNAMAIILGTYFGSRIGATLSYKITSFLLRIMFIGIMIFTAFKMFLKGLEF